MSHLKTSLIDLVSERQRKVATFSGSKQEEVQREANDSLSHIRQLQEKITSQKTALTARTDAFRESLDSERRKRNSFEEQKSALGAEIGRRYFEGLRDMEEHTQEKLDRLRSELGGHHCKVEREFSIFSATYHQLMAETPESYLQGANEQVDTFHEKRNILESGIRALETDIQQGFRRAAEQRIAAVDELEEEISAVRREIAKQRECLAARFEEHKARLKDSLRSAANDYGLVAHS